MILDGKYHAQYKNNTIKLIISEDIHNQQRGDVVIDKQGMDTVLTLVAKLNMCGMCLEVDVRMGRYGWLMGLMIEADAIMKVIWEPLWLVMDNESTVLLGLGQSYLLQGHAQV